MYQQNRRENENEWCFFHVSINVEMEENYETIDRKNNVDSLKSSNPDSWFMQITIIIIQYWLLAKPAKTRCAIEKKIC